MQKYFIAQKSANSTHQDAFPKGCFLDINLKAVVFHATDAPLKF